MRRGAVWLLAWGLWLGILTAVQALFAPNLIQFAIPGVASAACLASGLAIWALDKHRHRDEGVRLISDSSFATVTLVAGTALALVGTGFGLWLILIGAGVGALGLGGVVREQRARGRALNGRSTQ